MIKNKFPIFFVLIFALFFLKYVYSQEDMFFVSSKCFDNPEMSESAFDHDFHNMTAELYECNICHHIYDDNGEKIEDDSSTEYCCSDCHFEKSEKNKTNLRRAFHFRCKNCHIKETRGPIICGDCHSK